MKFASWVVGLCLLRAPKEPVASNRLPVITMVQPHSSYTTISEIAARSPAHFVGSRGQPFEEQQRFYPKGALSPERKWGAGSRNSGYYFVDVSSLCNNERRSRRCALHKGMKENIGMTAQSKTYTYMYMLNVPLPGFVFGTAVSGPSGEAGRGGGDSTREARFACTINTPNNVSNKSCFSIVGPGRFLCAAVCHRPL